MPAVPNLSIHLLNLFNTNMIIRLLASLLCAATLVLPAWAEDIPRPPLMSAYPKELPQVEQPPDWLQQALQEQPEMSLPTEEITAPKPAETSPAATKTVKKNSRSKAVRHDTANSSRVPASVNGPSLIIAPRDNLHKAQPPWFHPIFADAPSTIEQAGPPLLPGQNPARIETAEPVVPEEIEAPVKIESVLTKKLKQKEAVRPSQPTEKPSETMDMLTSLLELQKNLRQQMTATGKRLKLSASEAEKLSLQEELTQLDKQLSDTSTDFERIATGVEIASLLEQKPETYSWKDELTSLLEPAIKELKQLTARARQKTQLKDQISEFGKQSSTALRAVENLEILIKDSKDPKIKLSLQELLPAWQNAEKRVNNKLDLAQLELTKLQDKDGSLVKSSSDSIRTFFHDRGLYMLLAFLAFVVILLACRLIYRVVFHFLPGAKQEKRPLHIRILDIFFQLFSILSAICGLIFVLYTAEDWFLLSVTIIFFFGLAWTVRQALPRMWQQARLMLNLGAVREGERVLYNGVPWKVESINVFTKLSNPSLGMYLRIPIENMVGLISRPYSAEEPWFPCKKGDWVVIEGKSQAKVVSLSHEQIELVELGGRHVIYQTADFLAASPANLSRNFSIRLTFGLSYALQAEITTTVPETLKAFINKKLDENNLDGDCLNLSVEFLQAGASSLDLAVLADFKGAAARTSKRLERALNKWCVECCNANNWEIPFPQMTVHLPASEHR